MLDVCSFLILPHNSYAYGLCKPPRVTAAISRFVILLPSKQTSKQRQDITSLQSTNRQSGRYIHKHVSVSIPNTRKPLNSSIPNIMHRPWPSTQVSYHPKSLPSIAISSIRCYVYNTRQLPGFVSQKFDVPPRLATLPNKGGIAYTHLVYSISIPPLKLKYSHSITPITLQNFKLVTVASHNDANQECIHCHDECPSFPQSLHFRPSHRTSTSCDCCFHTSQGSTSTCTRQHLLLETLAFTGL